MAINDSIFRSLKFGGVDSADYGIYISGEGVYNAPRRAVEMVSVPGRNGDIAIDQGHYENIEVKYPCGTFGDDQEQFRVKLGRFRNAILAKRGYQRLEDEYHPDEYREALFVEAIEVTPTSHSTAGQFSLVFNCKPQRFLKAGEDVISVVTSPKNVPNPTPFESRPMLEVYGYGSLTIGDYEIELSDGSVGTIEIAGEESLSYTYTQDVKTGTITIDYSRYASSVNDGDDISAFTIQGTCGIYRKVGAPFITSIDGTSVSNETKYLWALSADCTSFTAFPSANETVTDSETHAFVLSNSATFSSTLTITATNKPTGVIEITATMTLTSDISSNFNAGLRQVRHTATSIDSSISTVGNPTYIDCDLGEAYIIDSDGNLVSLNALISFGSDLPQLSPDSTTLTFDNTITKIDLIPRWWRL
jgi:phage-related protein